MHAWVAAGHHRAEVRDGDTRVERGRRQPAMAEQRLDVAEIGAAAQQLERGTRVTCESPPSSIRPNSAGDSRSI